MAKIRDATVVLLTRGEGQRTEVFMAKRAPQLRFFGGYWAFLGGVVDEADHDGDPQAELALKRCGLRELFEESGVLPSALARVLDRSQRESLRTALLEGASGSAQRWRDLLDSNPDALAEAQSIGRITTPPFAPVLYRSLFIRVHLPAGEEPDIIPGELLAGNFVHPERMLEEWRGGEWLIVPPAIFFLHEFVARPFSAALSRLGSLCEEMRVGRLHDVRNTPGVCMVPLRTDTLPPATTTNTFIVGEERLYIIDPATEDERERRRLFDLLDRYQAQGHKLCGVIATHHHPDHIGSIRPVALRSDLPVLGHPLTLERLPIDGLRSEPLTDGSQLDLGHSPDGQPDWSLKAYHTPGHDRGHLVFVESRYQAALVGDLCSTLSTIVIDPPEGHMATYLASLRRMLSVPMTLLYPAHGPVQRDAHGLLRRYLRHREQREHKLESALAQGLSSIDELLPHVYDDAPAEVAPMARRSLLAGLEKLEEEGRATRLGERWIPGES